MSGSSFGYVPEIKSTEETDCQKLSIITTLTSPVPEVIVNLKVGDELEITKVAPSSIRLYNQNGELAGSLLSRDRDRLIKCLDDGFQFVGVVMAIIGANCRVQIRIK